MENLTGQVVRDLRIKSLEMSVPEFASLLTVSTKTVERWEEDPKAQVSLGGASGHKLEAIVKIVNDPDAKLVLKDALGSVPSMLKGVVGAGLLGSLGGIAGMMVNPIVGLTMGTVMVDALKKYIESKQPDDTNE